MAAAILTRFRPTGPWRTGAGYVFHSDTLYGAVTSAIARLDSLEEWLAATAQSSTGSAVRFSSLFPWQDELLYVVPPQTLWPSPTLGKGRWQHTQFLPLPVIAALAAGQPVEEDKWMLDAPSGCLVPLNKPGPFRSVTRSFAAVDRLTSGIVAVHEQSCLEFRPRAGLWGVIDFASDEASARWSGPVKAALRLLADSGIGGRRTQGWGHFRLPDFREGSLASLLGLPEEPPAPGNQYWLLSLFSPAEHDPVHWDQGQYTLVTRRGHVAGSGAEKLSVRLVSEGSVLVADAPPQGSARDVAPAGAAHPVYQAGFALVVPL